MRKFITDFAPKSVLEEIKKNINNSINDFKPFTVSFTDKEKIGVRSMGDGREGKVRLLSTIGSQFPDALARADNPEDLSKPLDYYADVRAVRAGALQLLEITEEIILGTGMDCMKISDRFEDNFQLSRKNNSALDLNMRDIDEYNKRFGKRNNDNQEDEPENPIP